MSPEAIKTGRLCYNGFQIHLHGIFIVADVNVVDFGPESPKDQTEEFSLKSEPNIFFEIIRYARIAMKDPIIMIITKMIVR